MKILGIVLVLLAQLVTYPPDYGDMSRRPKKGKKSAVGKTPKKPTLAEQAVGYWGMEECANDDRQDIIGNNDFEVTSGTTRCEAGYFGNMISSSVDNYEITASTWPNTGDQVVGQTIIWWTESVTAGAPTIAALFYEGEGATGDKQFLHAVDEYGMNMSAYVRQWPLGTLVSPPALAPTCSHVIGGYCFWALVIDGEDIYYYVGDSDGMDLEVDSKSMSPGNYAKWGPSFRMVASAYLGIDDFALFDWALSESEIKRMYNKGKGSPLSW